MRRSHRKSRKGCLECKRRHIKCDETRPRCINCQTVDRECSYPILPGTSHTGTGGGSDEPSLSSPADSLSVAATPPSSAAGSASVSVASFSSYGGSTATTPVPVSASGPGPEPGLLPHTLMPEVPPFPTPPNHGNDRVDSSPNVNMVHMELLYHYTTDIFITFPPLGDTVRSLTMHHALREPYLMYQILALSARHLSVLRPHREAFYHHHAIQLQTHALTLFNRIDMAHFDACIENRVPLFLFSSVLGFHALCDTLSYRDAEFPTTLTRFVGYLHLHRGIYKIMEGHLEELKQSELKPIIEVGIKLYGTRGTGPECGDLLRRLNQKFDGTEKDQNGESVLESLTRAVEHLQVIFDAVDSPGKQVQMLLAWGTMLRGPVMGMLEEGRPEVLAVLAYYFVCLHLCRKVWISGDSGRFLLESLVRYMVGLGGVVGGGGGGEWEEWLETPVRLMREADRVEDGREGQGGVGGMGGNAGGGGGEFGIWPGMNDTTITMSTKPKINISQPSTASEAARIAEIHLLAMQSNPLLHVQFPTPESQSALQDFLAKDTLQKMTLLQSSSSQCEEGILVARLEGNDEIVGFIRWDHPPHVKKEEGEENNEGAKKKKKLEEGEIATIPGCNKDCLSEYARVTAEVKRRNGFRGRRRCWHLTFVCVDPKYQGRGIGSSLTRHFLTEFVELDNGKEERMPVYLESTVEAVKLYEKLGFEEADRIGYFEMELPVRKSGEEGGKIMYRECASTVEGAVEVQTQPVRLKNVSRDCRIKTAS
ncbi:hypothetical protein B0T20DRAFT_450624 [Sordaria brevicollis]|uniref:Zn(2)-C6 fungal-type domain-containing protein n=1 Tax=Sordaria brevicollis TaxID=83679 RepID=A0AAE0PKM8_SORBR|nr:hypothetical protein B0T20DRAFT_450624 [Sordaria brevicollis]